MEYVSNYCNDKRGVKRPYGSEPKYTSVAPAAYIYCAEMLSCCRQSRSQNMPKGQAGKEAKDRRHVEDFADPDDLAAEIQRMKLAIEQSEKEILVLQSTISKAAGPGPACSSSNQSSTLKSP